jgi:hypothetical protein
LFDGIENFFHHPHPILPPHPPLPNHTEVLASFSIVTGIAVSFNVVKPDSGIE